MLSKLVLLFVVSFSCAYNVEMDWSYILRNPDTTSQEREAYFGYTVALVTSGYSSWALVGAPRANDTQGGRSNVKERGALYLCPLTAPSTPCRQTLVTDAANGSYGGDGNIAYVTLQDYGWLGGSLDLRPEQPDSVIVTCSPRWMNQINPKNDYYVNGACYITSISDITSSASSGRPWNMVVPLLDIRLQTILDDKGVGVFYYQLGQAGLSAHVMEGNDEVWLGAPGMQQWTGSVAHLKNNQAGGGIEGERTSSWMYLDSEVFKPAAYSHWDDYFGYSVASGHFFGAETSMVAGSPRHNLVGKVSVFTTTSGQRIQVRWEATGSQVGAYFGAAVATGDVNGDGWYELFVAAPLYSGAGIESGMVVIYSRKANLDDLKEGSHLLGSGQAGARFGSALMVVGDLDRDGYQDLAIGAPYDANGAGAVYIYRGSADGLMTDVSQILTSKDIDSNLRGFGISISRGADVDNNGYSDLAVGAYMGPGTAVVLRTRPVLNLHLHVSSEHEILTEIGMTFDVMSCVSYNGFGILDETGVILKGQVDDGSSLPRAVFVASGSAQTTVTATVRKGYKECKTFAVKIQERIQDLERPLQITFNAEVTYDNPGCEKCGLTSPGSNIRSRVSLPLAPGCGLDGVCTPELELTVKWQSTSQLALRSGLAVTLSISVSSVGKDQAYAGTVILLLPEGITTHQPLPYSCLQFSMEVKCVLPNPIAQGKVKFNISVKESGDLLHEGDVALKVISSASGAEDVKKEITLSLIEDVELELFGQVEEDMIQYSKTADSQLTYQIINRGDTRVNEIRLDIVIPTTYDEVTFAQIIQQPTSSSSTTDCSLEDSSQDIWPASPASNPPYEVSTKLVCGENTRLTCKRVICKVRQVHNDPIITIQVAYNITTLTGIFGDNFTIAFYTSAMAAYGSPTPTTYEERGIWTTLAPKSWHPPTKSIPAWAYVVAVLVGLLILAAVVMLLVKIGFFKRKRPEQISEDAEQDLEGQGEVEHGEGEDEATPLKDEESDGEDMTTTEVQVEADRHQDSN